MCACSGIVCKRASGAPGVLSPADHAQGYELDPDSWTLAEDVEDGCQELIAEYHERTCKETTGLAGGSRA